jgi:diguanylate cyclase (GGDEF)-like protein
MVGRIVTVTFLLIVANAIAQPSGQEVVGMAALLPVVAALPFLDRPGMVRAMAAAWFIAVLAVIYGAVAPPTTYLPEAVITLLRVVSIALICALLFVLLWQFGNRLKDAARDLRELTRMSAELTQTLDPRTVGDVAARHMAHALAADAVCISYWDQDGDRLLTYGYHPADDRGLVEDAYPLAGFPQTRRVLEAQDAVVVSTADRTADPAEVAYLRSIEHGSMVMLPLVARGRTIGMVEITNRQTRTLAASRMALARMFADEASMALDNARLHEELRRRAYFDALTDLANQVRFRERLAQALATPGGDRSVAVLFIDLDDFKEVNDGFGHTTGDKLLRVVAERIRHVVRPDDLPARFGGDEFAILLTGVDSEATAERVAMRVVESLAQPFVVAGRHVRIGASVGIATSAVSGADVDGLLGDADYAMYRAKAAGKNGFATFTEGMREAA